MSKHITDRDIGPRAAACVRERVGKHGDLNKQMARIGLERKAITSWENGGVIPSVYTLQRMAYAGYDVHYILTGLRKIPKNSAIDSPSDNP